MSRGHARATRQLRNRRGCAPGAKHLRATGRDEQRRAGTQAQGLRRGRGVPTHGGLRQHRRLSVRRERAHGPGLAAVGRPRLPAPPGRRRRTAGDQPDGRIERSRHIDPDARSAPTPQRAAAPQPRSAPAPPQNAESQQPRSSQRASPGPSPNATASPPVGGDRDGRYRAGQSLLRRHLRTRLRRCGVRRPSRCRSRRGRFRSRARCRPVPRPSSCDPRRLLTQPCSPHRRSRSSPLSSRFSWRRKIERLISTREIDTVLRHPVGLDLDAILENREVLMVAGARPASARTTPSCRAVELQDRWPRRWIHAEAVARAEWGALLGCVERAIRRR